VVQTILPATEDNHIGPRQGVAPAAWNQIGNVDHTPPTDGSSEMSKIEELSAYVNTQQTDWSEHLVHVELAMNNSVNATKQQIPTEMLYGTSVCLFPALENADTKVPAIFVSVNESIAIAKDNYLTAKTIQIQQANKNWPADPGYKEE
jgi:hypothetical protein